MDPRLISNQKVDQISPMKVEATPIFRQTLSTISKGTTSFSPMRYPQPLEIRGDKKLLNMNYLALQQQMMFDNQNKITGILYEAG
mmetsp:Transcript_32548/g.49790  ORF Transcript_32548/g.49790 Transcript_32548/m.49790 type:complete len:85 (-) Transcript_32548:24-278(-)